MKKELAKWTKAYSEDIQAKGVDWRLLEEQVWRDHWEIEGGCVRWPVKAKTSKDDDDDFLYISDEYVDCSGFDFVHWSVRKFEQYMYTIYFYCKPLWLNLQYISGIHI